MAWTAPRTYVAGEVITAAIGNTHWRDNLRYLKGLDGAVTLSDALILPDGAGYYLHIPSLTTTQRDALTPTAGMLIYNSTTTQFNKYENGAWRADLGFNSHHGDLSGLTDDDHTQYLLESLLTTQADLPYATAASTWARLPKGTGLQLLRMNSGATAPEWASAGLTFTELAGGEDYQPAGADGAWYDYDLSAIIGAGSAAVLVGMKATIANNVGGARNNGSSLNRKLTLPAVGNVITVIAQCDANRIIEIWKHSPFADESVKYSILGYWS